MPVTENYYRAWMRKWHTCVATHTARDALLLLLGVGVRVELKYDIGLFSFCYNRIDGEVEYGLFLLFPLPLGAAIAILKRGEGVGCAI